MEDEDFGFAKRDDAVLKNINSSPCDVGKNDEGSCSSSSSRDDSLRTKVLSN